VRHLRFLVLCVLCCACEDDQIVPTAADIPPTRDVGDAPNGYPVGFPLVPGARILDGGVDPGVIRTAVLEYRGACAPLEEALRAAFRGVNARVIDKNTLPDGGVALRVAMGVREASFSMHEELASCILRTIASDAPEAP
jgi:hypothetical protein